MVLFGGSLLNQFVGSFDRVNWLSTFRFDAVWFSDRRQWVQWIWDIHSVFDFWKIKIKIYVWVDVTIVSILNFDTHSPISVLLSRFNDGSDNKALLPWFLLKIRSGYDSMFGVIGLAVLSGLGHRYCIQCDSVVPKCTVSSVILWFQNVHPNGSVVVNQFSEKSEGVYFVILNNLNLYNGFKLSKPNVSKICTFLLPQIRAVEFVYLRIRFYTWKFRIAFKVLTWIHYCFLQFTAFFDKKKSADTCKMLALNLRPHNITCVVSDKITCGIVTNKCPNAPSAYRQCQRIGF